MSAPQPNGDGYSQGQLGGQYDPVQPAQRHDDVPQEKQGNQDVFHDAQSQRYELLCGPLLNYKHTADATSGSPTWVGSVLIVTKPGAGVPNLSLQCTGDVRPNGVPFNSTAQARTFEPVKLYEDPTKAFFRYVIDLPFQNYEAQWSYEIEGIPKQLFAVPSINQSMRIMFHSCNGFSVGTDVDAWSGPALWNDVLRHHNEKPFHVMIGGGDQIYNDGVRVDGPLKPWTDIGNPRKRREFPFPEKMRADCDKYYFDNYVRWYGTTPFSTANGQIAQLNIWDDHDIIDGFGSYTDHFMRAPVFRGIGGVAHKYYLLFQHHIAPPASTYTTDAPETVHTGGDTVGVDKNQLKDTFVYEEREEDPSYIIGKNPGPYVNEKSRSIYCQLGARIAFAGIDARIERTRHQINYPETYELIFDRINRELSANKNIKHIIILLGVPIAYPRLQWLENILTSPIIAPLRLLNKRFGVAGSFFNQFDGNVDLLDDLDDHYTARQHKHERKQLIHKLQEVAQKNNVRVSILGGDVHLAAIGRFFSSTKLGIPAENDFRYMPNIISSAITNKPPPQPVANLLARRNKIHHLDHDTDETLLEIFDRDPGRKPEDLDGANGNGEAPDKKTADKNNATMPSRNYAIIDESHDFSQHLSGATNGANGVNGTNGVHDTNGTSPHTNGTNGTAEPNTPPQANGSTSPSHAPVDKKNPRLPLHDGEKNAGTKHPAASGLTRTGLCGQYGLDVTLRVEISNKDREGHTEGYGFSIPGLEGGGFKEQGRRW